MNKVLIIYRSMNIVHDLITDYPIHSITERTKVVLTQDRHEASKLTLLLSPFPLPSDRQPAVGHHRYHPRWLKW